ncbi:MAG: hypothetical protein JWM91_2012 [Rhodospirillales bacterium]|nr:hypothetical protein [Rhodospirillales bacterium]
MATNDPNGLVSANLMGLEEHPGFWLSPLSGAHEPVIATVVIPTFSAATTLGRAIRSALNQTLQNIEVIVVDDASTDGSWDLIRTFVSEDSRLRAVRNKANCGKAVGMNRAIALARGRWLAVLDADDWFQGNRLSALLAIGERWQADMVADNQFFFDAIADRTVGTAWKPTAYEWRLTFDNFLIGSNAYAAFNFGMLKPIIRTDFMRFQKLDYDEEARHGQDFFHLLQFFLSGGRAVVTDTPYYHYTQPFGAISRQWSHTSRKRYDFQTALLISQRQLAAAADKLSPAQAASLKRRNEQLMSLEHFYQAKQCVRTHDLVGALRRLVRRPAMLSYAFWRLRQRTFGRADTLAIERTVARSRQPHHSHLSPLRNGHETISCRPTTSLQPPAT